MKRLWITALVLVALGSTSPSQKREHRVFWATEPISYVRIMQIATADGQSGLAPITIEAEIGLRDDGVVVWRNRQHPVTSDR
jgi:hypothetical protein